MLLKKWLKKPVKLFLFRSVVFVGRRVLFWRIVVRGKLCGVPPGFGEVASGEARHLALAVEKDLVGFHSFLAS